MIVIVYNNELKMSFFRPLLPVKSLFTSCESRDQIELFLEYLKNKMYILLNLDKTDELIVEQRL